MTSRYKLFRAISYAAFIAAPLSFFMAGAEAPICAAPVEIDQTAWNSSLGQLWPQIQRIYPYLGRQGLLIAILFKEGSAITAEPVFVSTTIVGAGNSPSIAWAMNSVEHESSNLKIDDKASFFLWLTPGARGYPAAAPSYSAAMSKGLLSKRIDFRTVREDGVVIRSRMISDAGYRQAVWLSQLEATASAAERHESTVALRQTAAALRDSATQAQSKLNEINAKLAEALRRSAKAEDALKILGGLQIGVSIAGKIADNWDAAMKFLGLDAPSSSTPIDSEPKAREYIIAMRDEAEKTRSDLLTQKSSLETDIQAKLATFRQASPDASTLMNPPS